MHDDVILDGEKRIESRYFLFQHIVHRNRLHLNCRDAGKPAR
jgi:hypothetical protein